MVENWGFWLQTDGLKTHLKLRVVVGARSLSWFGDKYFSSRYELEEPRQGLRRPNIDPKPFVFCEFCKSMHTHAMGTRRTTR
jgi:hypothetical protein